MIDPSKEEKFMTAIVVPSKPKPNIDQLLNQSSNDIVTKVVENKYPFSFKSNITKGNSDSEIAINGTGVGGFVPVATAETPK